MWRQCSTWIGWIVSNKSFIYILNRFLPFWSLYYVNLLTRAPSKNSIHSLIAVLCVYQSDVADKPVKCYSESDGDVYLTQVTTSRQLADNSDTQMSSLTEVCTVVQCGLFS